MLTHARALVCPSTLQHRSVSSVYPYIAVERSSALLSPVSEPRRWALGHVPLSTRIETLLVPRLSAHLQRPHAHVVGPEQTVAAALDPRDLSAVPCMLVTPHRQRSRYPYQHQLPLVLVATECRPVL